MKKGFFAAAILMLALTGCGASSGGETAQVADAIHTHTGIIAPGMIGDYQRLQINEYNSQSKSSWITYGNSISRITTYFRDTDVTSADYFSTSKATLMLSSDLDKVLYEGESSFTVNGQTFTGTTFLGYNSKNVRGGTDSDMHRTVVDKISVYEYGDHLLKVRSTNHALLGGRLTQASIDGAQRFEAQVLTGLLTTN
uniref:hypothetical protein n=1 Tax=Thaumasiovibrio occultus TaxID=1891184 RepID=UPI000B352472|nr:hypothetical protein [Thaumasiovibrio occultus]